MSDIESAWNKTVRLNNIDACRQMVSSLAEEARNEEKTRREKMARKEKKAQNEERLPDESGGLAKR